jgi:hypothetical protein
VYQVTHPTAGGRDRLHTSCTDNTLHGLAAPKPATLAVMRGCSFRGDGEKAVLDLASVIKALLN